MMMQNLLPKQAKKDIQIEYYLRLLTVCMLTFSVAVIIGLAALLPVYMDLRGELKFSENEQLARQQDKQDGTELQREIVEGEYIVTFLESEIKKEKCTELLSEALKERPEGIAITGFSYNRTEKAMKIEGVAATRDLVVPYARALEENVRFENVPVPISNLAKNTNLNFRLTLGIASTSIETQ